MAKPATVRVLDALVRFEENGLGDFICISDIAKTTGKRPDIVIQNWLRTRATVEFLGEWESLHNPKFNQFDFGEVKNAAGSNAFSLSPTEWIESMSAIGITSSTGRNGGTFAHFDIALHFCNWLSPRFYVHIVREFRVMKEREFSKKSLAWHLEKITNNIEEVRNLLDTIPGQDPERNRLNLPQEGGKEK